MIMARSVIAGSAVRPFEYIAIHCSATKEGQDVKAKTISEWHKARGFNEIGYNFVVDLDGTIEIGRALNKVGAHVTGYNTKAVGICYVGGLDSVGKAKDTRTPAQKEAIEWLVKTLAMRIKTIRFVQGHKDFPDVNKACPCFDARKEYSHLINR